MKKFFILFLAIFFIVFNASASGYYILDQTAQGVGDAFSGTVTGYGDGSEAYFNPAAMSQINSTMTSVNTAIIDVYARFNNKESSDAFGNPMQSTTENGGGVAAVPSAYFITPILKDLNFGFSFTAPYGMRVEYDDQWYGRYKADVTDLQIFNFAPALSYKLTDHFSIGANVGIAYADATLSNAIDFGTIGYNVIGAENASAVGLSPQNSDGAARLSADDWATNMALGALYTYGENDRNKVGLSWHSKTAFDMEGRAHFTVPDNASFLQSTGSFVDTGVTSHLTMPENIVGGTQYWITDRFALQTEMAWLRWSKFKELRFNYDSNQADTVEAEDWNNSYRYSAGALYKLTDDLTWKLGYMYDESPVTSNRRSPRIPDNDRHLISTGANYAINDCLDLTASYTYIIVNDTSVDISDSVGNRLNGTFDLGIQVVALGLTYSF